MMDDSLLLYIRAEISPPELLFFLLLDSTHRRTKNSYKSYSLLSKANFFFSFVKTALFNLCVRVSETAEDFFLHLLDPILSSVFASFNPQPTPP